MSAVARPSGVAARRAALVLAWVLGAAGLGAAFAASAWVVGPFVFPALCGFAALAVITVSRPAVGVAAAFPLLVAGNFGVAGNPPWVAPTAWAAFLLALAVLRPAEADEPRRLPAMGGALLLYLVVTVFSMLFSERASEAFPIVRSLVTGLMLFFAMTRLLRTREDVRLVLAGVAIAAAAIGAVAVDEWRTGTVSVSFYTASGALVGRASAGFGQPNSLGGYLITIVPFLLAAALAFRRGRILFAIALVLAVAGVYVSFSRGALVGLVLIPFVFLRARWALLAVPIVVLGLAIASPALIRERFDTVSTSGSEVATRVDFWRAAGAIWAAHPIAGVGIGSFPDAYATSPIPGKRFLPQTTFEPPPHAHNLFLNTLAEQGVIGLLALLTVVVAAVRTALRLRRDDRRWIALVGTAALAALLAAGIHNLFDVTLREQIGTTFWALLGVVSATASIAARPEHARPSDADGA